MKNLSEYVAHFTNPLISLLADRMLTEPVRLQWIVCHILLYFVGPPYPIVVMNCRRQGKAGYARAGHHGAQHVGDDGRWDELSPR